MTHLRYALPLLAMLLVAGCSGSREAAQPPHPAEGQWDYTIDSPDGVFTGALYITEEDGALQGSLGDGQSDQRAPLENVAYDEGMLTFEFSNPQYGRMSVTAQVEDDELEGMLLVHDFGAEVPIVATRAAEME